MLSCFLSLENSLFAYMFAPVLAFNYIDIVAVVDLCLWLSKYVFVLTFDNGSALWPVLAAYNDGRLLISTVTPCHFPT